MMIILSKIRNKLYWYKYKFYIVALKRETLKKIRKSSQKARIYYFLTPTHSNLGDQAQLMCWTKLFGQWYPKHEIIGASPQVTACGNYGKHSGRKAIAGKRQGSPESFTCGGSHLSVGKNGKTRKGLL